MRRFIIFLILTLSQSVLSIEWIGDFATFSTWNIKFQYLPENRQVIKDPLGGPEMVLKVKYQAGSYSTAAQKGGTGFYVHPFENITTGHVAFQYDVLFPNDFDFVLGGKLPGLFGGRHSCSGGSTALDCFTARFMWSKDGAGFPYLYVPKTAPHLAEFCAMTDNPQCAQDYGFSLPGQRYFTKEKWIRVKEQIKLNTPGVANGRLTVWADGVQRFDYDKIIFRTTNMVPITGFVFETFFGGNTAAWATPREVFSYYKGLRYTIM